MTGQSASHDFGRHTCRRHVLASAASGIQEQVRLSGGDPIALLLGEGLCAEDLSDGCRPIELSNYVSLMESASLRTGDENFGLHYGQVFTPEMLGLIGMIAVNSPTLGAALSNLVELFPYHQQATQTNLVQAAGFVRLEYRIIDGAILDRRQDAELTIGMFANVIRRCLGPRWSPDGVYWEHPQPANWRDHERVFNAPAHFSQRANGITISRNDLDRAMPAANVLNMAVLTARLRAISGGRHELALVDRVSAEIRSALPNGNAGIEDISARLAIPRWTLQRSLDTNGVSFSSLADAVRRQLAHRYITQRYIPVTDVAFLLGYSELSAFTRAFRRWFEMSPSQWRSINIPSSGSDPTTFQPRHA